MNKGAPSILYLTYDGLTDSLGQSQILPYLIGLSSHGLSFHVISCEKKVSFKNTQASIRTLIENHNIAWHPLVYHKQPPVVSSIYDLIRMRQKAVSLHKHHEFGAVWCRSYLPALIGLRLKRKFLLPLVFDMRGFWADERVEGGSWKLSHPIYRLVYHYFKRKEKVLLAEANQVVVLTEKAKQILLERQLNDNPIPKAISVVPCCVDTNVFDPAAVTEAERNAARQRLGIDANHKVLVYAGSLGTWYLTNDMLVYFKKLKESDPFWKFLIITKDENKRLLKAACEMALQPGDIITTPGSRLDMPLYLSLGHLAISFIMPVFSKQASSPTKLAEYMSMGLPVVCNKGVGDVDGIIQDSGAGWLVEENDSVIDWPGKTHVEIRQFALDHFSLQSGVTGYLNILK